MKIGARNDAYIHLYRSPRKPGSFERGRDISEQTGQIIALINRDKKRANGYSKTITHLIIYIRYKKDIKRCLNMINSHFDGSILKSIFISKCFSDSSILVEIQYRIQIHL